MSVILVGNGTSVLDNDNGELIDSFDTVVRFNSYKISGYEINVGTRTDILFTCNDYHINDLDTYRSVYVHSWCWEPDRCDIFKKLSDVRPCIKTSRDIVRSIPVENPSTGVIAIAYMIMHFKKVYITGFDWWGRDSHHYGDLELRGTLHDPIEELNYISSLEYEGKLEFL